jgi:thiol-disulfide isomerase/thioredoxin
MGIPLNAGLARQDPEQAYQEQIEKAKTLLEGGRYEEAIKSFKQANKLKKDSSAECYWGLARAYLKLGAHKNVIESCDRMLQSAADDYLRALAHNHKGVALVARAEGDLDKLKEAEREFRAALELSTNLTISHYNLGTTLLKQKRDAEGVEQLKLYLQLVGEGSTAEEARRLIEVPRRARENFAPPFSTISMQGEYISLEELRGKVVLLDFWATWCPPCRESIPAVKRLHKKLAKGPFVVISISSDRDEDKWRAFVAKEKMEWPHLLDRNGRINGLFNVRAIPTYFVIDAEGIVRRQVIGWDSSKAGILEGEIKKGLKAIAGDN